MATVFWGAQGIILIDYLQKGQTITGEYYATLLSRLHEKLRTERPKIGANNPLLVPLIPFDEFIMRFAIWGEGVGGRK